MIFSGLFNRRFRGFRIVDLAALAVLLALALASYAFKTFAEGVGADTASVESQIAQQERRIHLLRAEIAHLDDPNRIERLSSQYLGMQAVDPKQETSVDALPQVALKGAIPPVKPAAATVTAAVALPPPATLAAASAAAVQTPSAPPTTDDGATAQNADAGVNQ
ncbi:MAG TPA: cell division protein [Caulobacteraceae bacterium]